MEFFNTLNNICEEYDCYLEYVDKDPIPEYLGWENSWLIFSNDAKDKEVDIVVLRDTDKPYDFIHEFSQEKGLSASHLAVLNKLKSVYSVIL